MNIRLLLLLTLASITFSSLPIVYLPARYDKEECICSDESCSSLSCCDQNNSNCIDIPLCPAFEETPKQVTLENAWFNALEWVTLPLFSAVQSNTVPTAALQSAVELLSIPEAFHTAILQEDATNPALACSVTREFLVTVQSLGYQQFNGDFTFYNLVKEIVVSLVSMSSSQK